jgi:hypothetical protein
MGPFVYSGTVPTHADNTYFSGGAGMVATAGDYFRFGQMMMNGGELNGARVLKAETVSTMTKNQLGKIRIMPNNAQMGYGFGVVSEESEKSENDPAGVGTFSWGGAYGTFFWVDAVERSQALFALRDRWTARCQKARTSALLLKLIDMLFVSPYADAAHAAQELEVRHQSAQKNIDQLVTEGILEEITGQRRNRVYAAREIVRILEETLALDEPGAEPMVVSSE